MGVKDYIILLRAPFGVMPICMMIASASFFTPHENFSWFRLGILTLAMFFGVLIGAHGLDEMKGRPCHTTISDSALLAYTIFGGTVGSVLAVYLAYIVNWLFLVFIGIGVFMGVCYNLELLHIHTPLGLSIPFALVPTLSGYYIMNETLTIPVILFAIALTFWTLGLIHTYEHGKLILKDNVENPPETAKLAVTVLTPMLFFIYLLGTAALLYQVFI